MIEYIPDANVDADFDAALRALLTACFIDQPLFQRQRFYKEMPPHRWYIAEGERLIAHLALHEKSITAPAGDHRIGGVAEVCVHPDYRGRGYVKQLLQEAHAWLRAQGIPFAMLFGNPRVYSSSGYVVIDNDIRHFDDKDGDWKIEKSAYAMIYPLGSLQWPTGLIDLHGPMF